MSRDGGRHSICRWIDRQTCANGRTRTQMQCSVASSPATVETSQADSRIEASSLLLIPGLFSFRPASILLPRRSSPCNLTCRRSTSRAGVLHTGGSANKSKPCQCYAGTATTLAAAQGPCRTDALPLNAIAGTKGAEPVMSYPMQVCVHTCFPCDDDSCR